MSGFLFVTFVLVLLLLCIDPLLGILVVCRCCCFLRIFVPVMACCCRCLGVLEGSILCIASTANIVCLDMSGVETSLKRLCSRLVSLSVGIVSSMGEGDLCGKFGY